jgi:rRNA biogenesis protein RRP5
VKAVVIEIDKKRISFSLKPSQFTEEDLDGDIDENDSDIDGGEGQSSPFGTVEGVMMGDEDDGDEGEDDVDMQSIGEQSSVEGAEDDEDAMEIDEGAAVQSLQPPTKVGKSNSNSTMPVPTLSLSGGFKWHGLDGTGDADGTEEDSSGSESEGVGEESHKKKKKKRKVIEQDLTAELQTKKPESNADFERVLLGSPNSSYVWIQYISFQLQLSEIEKAREVARRAIKTISFREEQERLNVWIALLNLENIYGTDESLDTTFNEAARANDSKTIHLRLASILEQSGKRNKALEQYQKTSKKFGLSSKVWTSFAEFLLKSGNLEEARKILPRSFQSLEKYKRRSIF